MDLYEDTGCILNISSQLLKYVILLLSTYDIW